MYPASGLTMLDLVVKLLVVVLMLPSVVDVAEGQQPDSDLVTVKWGVADSTAVAGKLYILHIPIDAFNGPVLYYKVQNSDGSPLPNWIEFDNKTHVLQGIPAPSDAGQLFIDITAHGKNSQATVTSTIYVRDVPSHTSRVPIRLKSSGPEFVWCKPTESETVATVILDVDFGTLPVANRLKLLNKFISHMELHEDMVKMTPVGNSPLHDTSALVSGTGDCRSPKTSGLFVSWPVGCGQVKEGHFPVLQKLDEDSGNGKLAKTLGHSVIAWQVTNSHFQAPTRKKREIQRTKTAQVTPIVPTKTDSRPDVTDGKMTRPIVDGHSPTYIRPTATGTSGEKTDEPIVIEPPVDVDGKTDKVMPTEMTPTVLPVTRTADIKPTKPDESMRPTDGHIIDDSCVRGQKPNVKKPLLEYTYDNGQVIDINIPEDTFEDCEVGNTPGLDLQLFKDEKSNIPPDFFVQFDSKKQRIIGLPMGQGAGTYKFNLVGKKNLLLAATGVTIVVKDAVKREINHELAVTVDYDYNKFKASVSDKVSLANRIAAVYGDNNSSRLIITKIQEGSVIFGWTNSSLPSKGCPTDEIKGLVGKLFNEDGTLSDAAKDKLKPFVLLSAAAQPAGDCKDNPQFPVAVSKREDTTTGEEGSVFWLTIVISVVVVVFIIVIAIVIGCIVYRRKRKGKMNVEEKNTFINKGKPIIFPNELEDKPGDANKPLLIEGNPSAPPGYHRGASESPEPQVAGNYRNLYASGSADDDITELPEKPYEPPPPLAANNGKQPRPPHQQQPVTQAPVILP